MSKLLIVFLSAIVPSNTISNLFVIFFIVNGHQFIHANWSIFIIADVHDDAAKASELGSTYRLCEEVANHFISWTVLNCDLLTLLHICNEESSDVHVPRPFVA